MHRTSTVEFSPVVVLQDSVRPTNTDSDPHQDHHGLIRQRRSTGALAGSHPPIAEHPTTHTYRSTREPQPVGHFEPVQPHVKYTGLGGFPMPHQILGRLLGWLFPATERRLRRTVTIPATTTIAGSAYVGTYSNSAPSHHPSAGVDPAHQTKPVSYISFDAIVGRNSAFYSLTNEQLEELGGVEYRALNVLLWLLTVVSDFDSVSPVILSKNIGAFPLQIVPRWYPDHCFHRNCTIYVDVQVVQRFHTSSIASSCFASMVSWSLTPNSSDDPQHPSRYSFFQVVSAYTNTGMSLVDQSMIPFQTAYPLIIISIICIFAGYTAFVGPHLCWRCQCFADVCLSSLFGE